MRVLIIVPHPNDEMIGAGGTIATACDAGHHVSIAHLASGEQGSGYLTVDQLRPARQAEAVPAAVVVGVPEDRVLFLGGQPRCLSPLD